MLATFSLPAPLILMTTTMAMIPRSARVLNSHDDDIAFFILTEMLIESIYWGCTLCIFLGIRCIMFVKDDMRLK